MNQTNYVPNVHFIFFYSHQPYKHQTQNNLIIMLLIEEGEQHEKIEYLVHGVLSLQRRGADR